MQLGYLFYIHQLTPLLSFRSLVRKSFFSTITTLIFCSLNMSTTIEHSASSVDNRSADERKQSPPAFLDLADSVRTNRVFFLSLSTLTYNQI